MALNISGRMKVKTLKSQFKDGFGLSIRIYDGRSFADDDATLASIRKGDSKGGEFSPKKNTKVGNLEDKIMEMFGIKTQISGSDDSYLCNNDLTLKAALEEDELKMGRKDKKVAKNSLIPTTTQEDVVEKNKRYYKVDIVGTGGEYAYGIVHDEDQLTLLRERLENNEIALEMYGDEVDLMFFDFNHQLFHCYGPNIEESYTTISIYEDEGCEEEIEEIVSSENTDSVGLHIFFQAIFQNLSKQLKDKFSAESLQFGGYYTEKRIHFPIVVAIDEDHEFDVNNLYVGTIWVGILNTEVDIPRMAYYIPRESAQQILKIYLENDEDVSNPEDEELSEYFEDLLIDIKNGGLGSIQEILDNCRCEILDIEGKGESEEHFAIVKDMDDEILFDDEC